MSTPNQPGDWQQQGHPGQYGPPQGQPGQYGPPPGQQGPQEQPYGPPPGWTPPGGSPYGGGAPEPPKKKHRLRKLLIIVGAVLVAVVACTVAVSGGGSDPAPTVSGGTGGTGEGEAPAGPTFPGQQEGDTVAEVGQTITIDGVEMTAAPLVAGEALGTTPVVCSAVSIINGSDESVSFNPFYFELQDPAGASRSTTIGGSDTRLGSGDLAPGGTVTGDVCWDDPGAPGQNTIIHDALWGDRAAWVQTR